jgi:hypothetical protein
MPDRLDIKSDGCSVDIEQLDITSYLPAQYNMSICNKHVGTVCLIFTGLSDMGWQQKRIAFYNLIRYNVDKIV